MFDNLNLFDLEDMQDLTVVYVGGVPTVQVKPPTEQGRSKVASVTFIHPTGRNT